MTHKPIRITGERLRRRQLRDTLTLLASATVVGWIVAAPWVTLVLFGE